MARPNNADQRRSELLPVIAAAFGDLGYRRATTAEIAAKCGVRENILYRLWDDKRAMFLAAIDFLFQRRMGTWQAALSATDDERSRADRLIDLTAKNLGEDGLYRVIFAALAETHDDGIRHSVEGLFRRYHRLLVSEISEHRRDKHVPNGLTTPDTAWGLIALVTFMNVAIDLELMDSSGREKAFAAMAHFVVEGMAQ